MLSIINWTPIVYAWLAILAFYAKYQGATQIEMGYVGPQKRAKPIFAWVAFAPIFIFVVFGVIRYDMYAYLSIFHYMVPDSFSTAGAYIAAEDEKGFAIFSVLIKTFFGENETAFRFAIALVHTIPVVLVLRKYSENYLFSLYVFLALGMHQAWMMNGLRQFMAVTIIFASTPWMVEKKYFRCFLVVLLAVTFHRSAMIMLPVVYFATKEAWSWRTTLIIIGISAATLLFSRSDESFDAVAEIAGYSLDAVRAEGDDGMNPIRLLVFAVPTILAFRAREELKKEGDPLINLCVNMSILTVGISAVAVVTSGILTGRMPIYTNLYNLILLPRVIRANFKSRSERLVSVAAIAFYYIYSLFD